jgi:transposase
VARVARSHGINANQIFAWRKLHLAGKLVERAEPAVSSQRLLQVTVIEAERPSEIAASIAPNAPPAPCASRLSAASIQIQLPKAMVRVEGIADSATLRLILECLRG